MTEATLPLRPYQLDAIIAVDKAAERGLLRPLVVLPTGAGKTVTFAHAIQRRGGRALILAHRDELLTQAADKIRQVAPGLTVGMVKAEQNDHQAQVVIASVQTLVRSSRLDQITRDFRTVIVDEAHHATAGTYMDVLRGLGSFRPGGPLTVGFTATAGRADGVGLCHVWEEIVYQRGILQMIVEGYLVDVRGLEVTSDVDFSRVHTVGDDFASNDLGAELERSGALEAAAIAYRRYAADRRGIAFTPTIATAQALAEQLRAQTIKAEALDGTMRRDERRAILGRLRTGETQVVTNCAVLTEGFDEPSVACILLARPTKSVTLYSQMVGRGVRPFPGKEDALVLDVVSASAETGLATIADLAGLPPKAVKPGETLAEAAEREAQGSSSARSVRSLSVRHIDLFAQSRLRWLPVDSAFVLPVGSEMSIYLVPVADDRWDVIQHPRGGQPQVAYRSLSINYAQGVGEEIARAQGGALSRNDAPWRLRAPSARQREALGRMGFSVEEISGASTAGAASDLMARRTAAGTVRRLLAGAR